MGLLKYKTKPDIIICEYEMNTEDEIDIITGCGQNDSKKLKIYVLKKINGKNKRFPLENNGKKKKFSETKITVIIKNDESITNLKGLFKGCNKLKKVDFKYFDFSKFKEKQIKDLFEGRCSSTVFVNLDESIQKLMPKINDGNNNNNNKNNNNNNNNNPNNKNNNESLNISKLDLYKQDFQSNINDDQFCETRYNNFLGDK